MKVVIKNKIFSFTGSSFVLDENGKKAFRVKGRFLSPTRVKWICDPQGHKLYKVRNKFWNWFKHSAYVYDADGNKLAKIVHPFFGIKKFIVQGYQNEILIDGKFFSLESTIMKDGQPVGKITRNLELFRDAFTLEADAAEMPFMIALVIAIDNITDQKMSE